MAFKTKADSSLMLHVPRGSAASLLSVDLSLLMEQPLATSLFLFRAGEKENEVKVHASSSCFLLEVIRGHWPEQVMRPHLNSAGSGCVIPP